MPGDPTHLVLLLQGCNVLFEGRILTWRQLAQLGFLDCALKCLRVLS